MFIQFNCSTKSIYVAEELEQGFWQIENTPQQLNSREFLTRMLDVVPKNFAKIYIDQIFLILIERSQYYFLIQVLKRGI